jgi:hypothetical protein
MEGEIQVERAMERLLEKGRWRWAEWRELYQEGMIGEGCIERDE